MKVAVFGCLHGQLNDMFNAVDSHERKNNIKIDLIIVCGDCQTIRHEDDLRCLAVPQKYQRLGDFHEYYSGAKKVPWLTIFVGGNHEASNYLMTLPYGGWVCDNFYYLGFAGVVKYRGLRIGGVSGIYNSHDCNKGRYERLPLDRLSVRSIYHTRRLDIFRLSLLSGNITDHNQLDVFMSHDWPAKVYEHGDWQQLLRFKPAFRQDVERPAGLGSPITRPLIMRLKPRRWFAAHLHCRFQAKVKHDQTGDKVTEFLSLSKIEQGRHFAEYLDISPSGSPSSSEEGTKNESPGTSDQSPDNNLYYDEEWLTILRKTVELEYKSSNNVPCPNPDDEKAKPYYPTNDEIEITRDMMLKSGGLQIKRNFCMAEPVIYNREDGKSASIDRNREIYFPNPQHVELCSRLGITDRLANNPVIASSNSAPQNKPSSHGANDLMSDRSKNNHYVHPNAESRLRGYASGESRPVKKQAVELDEDGCLPFFIDKKGDP